MSDGTATYPQEAGGQFGFKLRRVGGKVPADGTMYFFFVNRSTGGAATARLNVYKYSTTAVAIFLHPQNGWFVEIAINAHNAIGSMAYEDKDDYKSYAETVSTLSADGYALKSDIPSIPTAAEISAEIHLSDYSLTSHNHDETYLKEVPTEYKTYDATVSSLSNDGYAKTSDLSDIPAIKQDIIESKTQLSAMLSCLPLSKTECSLSNIVDALYSLKA